MCPPLCCNLHILSYSNPWGIFISHFMNKQSRGPRGWKSLDTGDTSCWVVVCVGSAQGPVRPRSMWSKHVVREVWPPPWQCGEIGQGNVLAVNVREKAVCHHKVRAEEPHCHCWTFLPYFIFLHFSTLWSYNNKEKDLTRWKVRGHRGQGKTPSSSFFNKGKWGWKA